MNALHPARFFLKEIFKYICILLFCYASISKLLDFEQFRIQLGQSPMLSAFADYLTVGVPSLELFIVALLSIPRLELIGFYGFYSLMVMFTTYIILILNFASYVPCSCGGVLQNMNWNDHLLFNLSLVLLAILVIFSYRNMGNHELKRYNGS